MKIDKYVLHCSDCEPSGFCDVEADKVRITLNLDRDEYVFQAICPKCSGIIKNTRRT